MYIKVKSGRRSAILNLIKLKFFAVYPYLKPHILFYTNSQNVIPAYMLVLQGSIGPNKILPTHRYLAGI